MTKRYICYFASFMVLVEIIMMVMGMDFDLCVAVAIVACGIVGILYVWRKPEEEKKEEVDYTTAEERRKRKVRMPDTVCLDLQTKNSRKNMTTTELCLDLLEKLNCEYEQDEESKEQYYFKYKGVNLCLIVHDGMKFARIFDMHWMKYPVCNLEMFSLACKAVNEVNKRSWRTKVVYTIEDGILWINSDALMALDYGISDLDQYFSSTLDCLLDCRNFYDDVMYDLLKGSDGDGNDSKA